MDVKHCPRCGSDVKVQSNSYEYSSSTRWICKSCDWNYKKGSGVGTASKNAGTHPRKIDSNQKKLTESGEWCSTCETCAKEGKCKCVKEDDVGLCKSCAKYSKHDIDDMMEVKTYFGKYKDSPWTCEICEETYPEYKINGQL